MHKGLENKLLLMKILGFIYLKYILLSHNITISLSPLIQLFNTLTRLIDFKHQFLAQKYENTYNILLYNYII